MGPPVTFGSNNTDHGDKCQVREPHDLGSRMTYATIIRNNYLKEILGISNIERLNTTTQPQLILHYTFRDNLPPLEFIKKKILTPYTEANSSLIYIYIFYIKHFHSIYIDILGKKQLQKKGKKKEQ